MAPNPPQTASDALAAAALRYREIPGFSGYYASDDGHVFSTRYRGGQRRSANFRGVEGVTRGQMLLQWLAQRPSRRGHPRVDMYDNEGKKRTLCVHQLVALAHIGPVPDDRPLVCHKNGKPTDNRRSNLYYGTHSDNQRDRVRHGQERAGQGSMLAAEDYVGVSECDDSMFFIESYRPDSELGF